MADEKKESWLSLLALTTVIFAVCATLATFKGGGYSTRAVMSQGQASDQWAFFQSKSIKGYQYEMAKDKLELELKVLGAKASKDVLAEYKARIEDYGKKIQKYEKEKADIQKEGKRFEDIREDAKRHGAPFGLAVIFLQISILLSGIATLVKQKPVYYLGLAMGIVGILYFIDGFLLWKSMPFL